MRDHRVIYVKNMKLPVELQEKTKAIKFALEKSL